MSWVLFYLLAALHPVAFLVIAWKCETWKMRLLLWALLPIPAVVYCWDYYAIQREHAQMCAAEGGLKVLIQPEKVDRVRFVGATFRNSGDAKYALNRYYPTLQVTESLRGEYDGTDGRGQPYVSYTAANNPRAGLPMDKFPWKEPKIVVSEPWVIEHLDGNVYEISVRELHTPYRSTITETLLTKQGKVYAKHKVIVHWWAGIQYPDAVPTWRCPEQKLVPPKDLPDAPKEQWNYPESATDLSVKLILK